MVSQTRLLRAEGRKSPRSKGLVASVVGSPLTITAQSQPTRTSCFPNREKYGFEVPMAYEFKTRLLERLKVIRHSSRPSPEAGRDETGSFRHLVVDQKPFS